jgi:hypothetical protein
MSQEIKNSLLKKLEIISPFLHKKKPYLHKNFVVLAQKINVLPQKKYFQ